MHAIFWSGSPKDNYYGDESVKERITLNVSQRNGV
jgi:hypothetical protein